MTTTQNEDVVPTVEKKTPRVRTSHTHLTRREAGADGNRTARRQ